MKTMYGIEYIEPNVYVLQKGSLGVAEYAARTAYDSFEASEHLEVLTLNRAISGDLSTTNIEKRIKDLNSIESSELLDKLVWAYHHESVVEHVNISFLVQNISRGVLQELARHRIASYTVRSTRYTMQNLLHAFNVAQLFTLESIETFKHLVKNLDLFTVTKEAESLEILSIYHKLNQQQEALGLDTFLNLSMSKDARKIYGKYAYSDEMFIDAKELYNELTKSKSKRNVGDPFKWIVTDNWSVDLVMTFNLRSLKNFIQLRDSGAAFFQIQWLANEVKKSLPKEYLKLIKKENK